MRGAFAPGGSSPSSVEARLQSFVDRVAHALAADIVTLHRYDPVQDKFYLPVGYGLMDVATFKHAMPRSDRVAGTIVRERRTIIADDAPGHPEMGGPFTGREGVASAAGFPIVLGESVAGVLFVNYRKPHAFSEGELRVVQALLSEAVEILAAAELAEVRRRLTITAPSQAVADRRLDFIIGSACGWANVQLALWTLDLASGAIAVRASTGLRPEFVRAATVERDDGSFVAEVARTGQLLTLADLQDETRFPFQADRRREGWASLLAVPVRAGGHVLGVLAMFSGAGHEPAAWELDLLRELAERAGDTLAEERSSQVLARLHGIGLALAARRDLAQVLGLIADSALEVFGADIVTLYTYDARELTFTGAVARDRLGECVEQPLPSATGVAAQIVSGGSPVFADEAESDPHMSRGFIQRYRVTSSAGFPLKVGDEVVGVLFINYRTPYQFLEDDRELIALFASQAALAIKNARLFEEERRRGAMASIAATFLDTLDRQSTLQAIVKKAWELTDATNSSLFLFNPETASFDLCAEWPENRRPEDVQPRAQGGLSASILETGQPLLIHDASRDARVRPSIVREGVRSIVGVPVRIKGEQIGVLFAHSIDIGHFSREDIGLLQSLAGYGAIAIERTRPFEAVSRVNDATSGMLGLDGLVTELLRRIVNELSFGFAALQLINCEEKTIETVDGINAPWGAQARHLLDSDDIQADIVRTRKTEVIAGPDPRFDPGIYERFGHEHLVRVFTPIVAGDTVLGTVEAGFDLHETPEISEEKLKALLKLVAEYAPRLAEAMLPHVLQVIVTNAVGLMRAHSGSIHVGYREDERRYTYQACAGRIGQEFLDAYPPGEQGIGQESLRRGSPLWIDDPEELKRTHGGIYAPERLWQEHPGRYRQGEGVRAIACCPLVSNGGRMGVLYIHFWHEHTFSHDEMDWLALFGKQVAAAIEKARFYEKLRDRTRALAQLSMMGDSLISVLQVSSLLNLIARSALDVLQADIVTIYQYDQERDHFATPPAMEGDLRQRGLMETPVEPGDAPWLIVRQGRSWYARDAEGDPVMCRRRVRPAKKGPAFVIREGIRSSAGILLKVRQSVVGVMFVNYRTRQDFTDSERQLIEGFASYAAIAIRNAREVDQGKMSQLETIQVIDREISITFDLDRVLRLIVEQSMSHLLVTDGYGILQLVDPKSKTLVTRAQVPPPPPRGNGPVLPQGGLGLARVVAERREPMLVADTAARGGEDRLMPDVRSQLAVPLLLGDRLMGVLDLESRRPHAFDEAGLSFLKLLAAQAVVAIQNANYVEQLGQLFTVLQQITSYTELRKVLEQIAESVLTLLNADDAVIFPYDQRSGEFALDQVVHRGQSTRTFSPGKPKPGGSTFTVLEKGLLAVEDVTTVPADLYIGAGQGLMGDIGTQAFIGVALLVRGPAGDNKLGVLYVDYREPHHFTDAEKALVQAFADQAAIAIQIVRQEEERRRVAALSAFNDLGAHFLHRVANLLGSLPLNFEELKSALEAGDGDRVADALPCLEADVTSLREILKAARGLHSRERGARQLLDINQAVRAALRTFPRLAGPPGDIEVVESLADGLPPVLATEPILSNIFTNLIDNAVRAMPMGGRLTLSSACQSDAGDRRLWVVVRVADSGVGMAEDVRQHAFELFFSGREGGLGLGLWLVQKDMQELGGEIGMESRQAKGTAFTLRFPAATEAR